MTTPAEIEAKAMSSNEANYGKALLRLHIDFEQQVLLGLYSTRGSQFIDLVAYVPPRKTAIFIQGEHWHGGARESEDQLKQAAAEHAGYRVLAVSEQDSASEQAALEHARRNLL